MSTPAAPLLAATFWYACHTSCFVMSNGLPGDSCSPTRFLPVSLVDQANEPRISRPLRSAPTASSRNFTATTDRSARAPRDSTQPLAFQTLGVLPLDAPPSGDSPVSGHAIPRSAQEPQTRLAPPLRRAPPGQRSGQPPGSSRAKP